MLLKHQILNIKDELNRTGYGFVILKELKEIAVLIYLIYLNLFLINALMYYI